MMKSIVMLSLLLACAFVLCWTVNAQTLPTPSPTISPATSPATSPTTMSISIESRMQAVARSIALYATENRGRLPPSLGYTLATSVVDPSLLVPADLPAEFPKWTLAQKSMWIDDHTDFNYLYGWQHAEPRKWDGDGNHYKFGTPKVLKGVSPVVLYVGPDDDVFIGFSDGAVAHYREVNRIQPRRP